MRFDGFTEDRRRAIALGARRGRRQQELGAAADRGVHADTAAVRADQRAADPRRGRAARPDCRPRSEGRRPRHRHAAQPVGDFPARRTIATHIEALTALGAHPLDEPGHAMHAPNGLKGASFYLDEASVTGTETALLAAAAAKGSSEIRHAAMEPHVVELCEFLQGMGVGIHGAGSSTIRVEPAARLGGASHRLAGDYIEAGSWGVVAAITNGEIEVTGARSIDLEVIAAPLKRMNLDCSYDNDRLV